MKLIKFVLLMAVTALAASSATAQNLQINGAGATFPYPIYSGQGHEVNDPYIAFASKEKS